MFLCGFEGELRTPRPSREGRQVVFPAGCDGCDETLSLTMFLYIRLVCEDNAIGYTAENIYCYDTFMSESECTCINYDDYSCNKINTFITLRQ